MKCWWKHSKKRANGRLFWWFIWKKLTDTHLHVGNNWNQTWSEKKNKQNRNDLSTHTKKKKHWKRKLGHTLEVLYWINCFFFGACVYYKLWRTLKKFSFFGDQKMPHRNFYHIHFQSKSLISFRVSMKFHWKCRCSDGFGSKSIFWGPNFEETRIHTSWASILICKGSRSFIRSFLSKIRATNGAWCNTSCKENLVSVINDNRYAHIELYSHRQQKYESYWSITTSKTLK